LAPAGAVVTDGQEEPVLHETEDHEEIVERVAALDIGKAEVVSCVRVPSDTTPGRRMQEVQTYPTMTRSLLAMADRFRDLGDPGGDGGDVGLRAT